MKRTARNAICFTAMALIFAVVLAANILCAVFNEVITGWFFGSGITYDSQAQQEALEFSDELCKDITEEGIVLLKNNAGADGSTVLPFAEDTNKVNIFGWTGSK